MYFRPLGIALLGIVATALLAGPGRAHEKDEITLRDDEIDVAEGRLAVRVDLRHVVEDEHGPICGHVVAADPPQEAAPDGGRGCGG